MQRKIAIPSKNNKFQYLVIEFSKINSSSNRDNKIGGESHSLFQEQISNIRNT